AQAAARGEGFAAAHDSFRARQKEAAAALLKDITRRQRLWQLIDAAADELGAICQSLAILREHTQRVLDVTAARGERLLAQLFCE
ncbi:hypothetical protein ACXYUI_30325, partial [Klebsiella pneumoniae]